MIDKDRSLVAFINFLEGLEIGKDAWLEVYLKDGSLVYFMVKVCENRQAILRLVEEPSP